MSISRAITASVSVGGPNLRRPWRGVLAPGSTFVSPSLDGPPPYIVAMSEFDWSDSASATVHSTNAVVTYIPINTNAIVPTLMVRTPANPE